MFKDAPLNLFCFLFLCQVMTLPSLQDVCLPTAAFMRVWQLEGQRLARILRGQHLTLRYQHFQSRNWCSQDSIYYWSFLFWVIAFFPPDQEIEADQWNRPLCATATKRGRSWVRFAMLPGSFHGYMMCVIRKEALLLFLVYILYFHLFQSPKEVLLNVKMGVPGERCYYPPEELVWDASRDSSPRSLRTCLASHYGLSPDSLLLAKHQPEKHTWEEISNWVRWEQSHFLSLFCLVWASREIRMYTCTRLLSRKVGRDEKEHWMKIST